jgi:GNAT superfamily N-acetyltransferase
LSAAAQVSGLVSAGAGPPSAEARTVREHSRMTVRPALPADVPEILAMIRELATYEREPDAVLATEEDLQEALFGEQPRAYALIADHPAGEDGALTAGFALYFLNFSTWRGRCGIYLEDLFVRPAYRGYGYGKALLTELARLCVDRSYGRLEWAVLDWNEPAMGFYRSLGARPMTEWTTWRVDGAALESLGGGS